MITDAAFDRMSIYTLLWSFGFACGIICDLITVQPASYLYSIRIKSNLISEERDFFVLQNLQNPEGKQNISLSEFD